MNNRYMFISTIDDLRQIYSPNDNICPYYLIDRNCRIFSEYSGLELTQIITESGYHVVSLNTTDGRRIQRRVHRLGMFTFCYFDGCEEYQVDHKDGQKSNNSILNNLEWVKPKENVSRAIKTGLRKSWESGNNPKAKISTEDAINICNMVINGFSNEEIIDIIPQSNDSIITQIVLGNTWKNIISEELVNKMKSSRYPLILTDFQKHQICKYYQDFPLNLEKNYKGAKKDYINSVLTNLQIPITDSTHRIAKRLFYKYQNAEITSLYNY